MEPEVRRVFIQLNERLAGVGSIATQIAKKVMKSHKVIATASREETIAFCKKMGADHVINHRKDLAEELKNIGVAGVDIVFCCVDIDLHFDKVVEIINPCGKIVSITIGDSTKVLLPIKLPIPLTFSSSGFFFYFVLCDSDCCA